MKKVCCKCNWPLFINTSMSFICSVCPCCGWLISKRYEFQQQTSTNNKCKNHPKHRNGLTKCKRHVITNQKMWDAKLSTNVLSLQFVSNFETPSKLFPINTLLLSMVYSWDAKCYRAKMSNDFWTLKLTSCLFFFSSGKILRKIDWNWMHSGWICGLVYFQKLFNGTSVWFIGCLIILLQ